MKILTLHVDYIKFRPIKKALKDAGIANIDVQHSPVDDIPKLANVVFTQESLVERARKSASSDATIIAIKNFLDQNL